MFAGALQPSHSRHYPKETEALLVEILVLRAFFKLNKASNSIAKCFLQTESKLCLKLTTLCHASIEIDDVTISNWDPFDSQKRTFSEIPTKEQHSKKSKAIRIHETYTWEINFEKQRPQQQK